MFIMCSEDSDVCYYCTDIAIRDLKTTKLERNTQTGRIIFTVAQPCNSIVMHMLHAINSTKHVYH